MKSLVVIMLFFVSAYMAFAETSLIFSVVEYEYISDERNSTIYVGNGSSPSAINIGDAHNKKTDHRRYEVLVDKNGAISICKDGLLSGNLEIYKPGEYFAEIIEKNRRVVISRANFEFTEYSSFSALLYMALNLTSFTDALVESKPGQKYGTAISNESILYSDDALSYSISLKDGRITSIDAHNKHSKEKFSTISLSYASSKSPFPKEATLEIFSKGKIQLRLNLAFELLREAKSEEAQKLFDTRDLGEFEFTDMRLAPLKIYNYSNGIPPVKVAEALQNIAENKGMGKWPESKRISEPPSLIKSDYIARVNVFFKDLK